MIEQAREICNAYTKTVEGYRCGGMSACRRGVDAEVGQRDGDKLHSWTKRQWPLSMWGSSHETQEWLLNLVTLKKYLFDCLSVAGWCF